MWSPVVHLDHDKKLEISPEQIDRIMILVYVIVKVN